VLLYHGLVEKPDDINVCRDQFAQQMEALRQAGYYTITSADLVDFYGGKEFGGKPILITFDDGRKDSYYGADKILEQLSFKATMYVATGKQLEGANFFLTWNELGKMKNSGRWELEPHGRDAHDRIKIDQEGNDGHFLTNKMWLDDQGRLETDGEAALRIIGDYSNAKEDLLSHFPDLQLPTYAVPLGDYGSEPNNFPRAAGINMEALTQFYKIGMVQDSDGYNYRTTNPYRTKRFAVKSDWDAQQLLGELDKYGQLEPQLIIGNKPDAQALAATEGGNSEGIFLAADNNDEQAENVYGNGRWSNYSVEVVLDSVKARSFSIEFLRKDSDNYASFGFIDDNFYLRQRSSGVETDLAVKSNINITGASPISLSITVDKSNIVNAYYGSDKIFGDMKIPNLSNSGAVGLSVWSNEPGAATADVAFFQVSPIREVLAYFSYANEAEAFSSLERNAEKIDYVTPSWYRLDADGSVSGNNDEKLASLANKYNVGLLPLLANYDPTTQQASADIASAIVNDPGASSRAISEANKLSMEKGFSGYNLDFEGLHAEDRDALSAFVEQLASELHRNGKLLYASLSAKKSEDVENSWTGALDYGRIGKAVDKVIIMAYNESWSNSPPGAFQSDLYIQEVAQFAADQIDKSKIMIGFGLYGMDWAVNPPSSGKTLSYTQVMEIKDANAAQHEFDVETQTQKLVYNDGTQDHEVWYEDHESFAKKLGTPDRFEVAGIAIWSLGREDPRIWDLLARAAGQNR
jgi:spore germination protein